MQKVILLALIVTGLSACKTNNVDPRIDATNSSDTSTSLVANTALVGFWYIVTDTISSNGGQMYQGVHTDHFIFTRYGNLYIHNGLNQQVDTAIYIFSPPDQVQWTYTYYSENGIESKAHLTAGPYQITGWNTNVLSLTKKFGGAPPMYEQIRLIK